MDDVAVWWGQRTRGQGYIALEAREGFERR
jgi:hypothetical protein